MYSILQYKRLAGKPLTNAAPHEILLSKNLYKLTVDFIRKTLRRMFGRENFDESLVVHQTFASYTMSLYKA